ncbi:MAG: two-component regulator propeller domain-containing protein [Pseudomonadota bacterium]
MNWGNFTQNTALAIVAALTLGYFTPAASATETQSELPPMIFSHLGVDQGLSQSNVLVVHQDATGIMWLGTENGLNSYDGYRFEQYRRERGNPSALYNDFIFDIAETADGALWIATNGGGLARFDRETKSFTTYLHDAADKASIGSNSIRRLAVAPDGALYIATSDAGLYRFDIATESFESIALVAGTGNSNKLFELYIDARERLWVGGDHGLSRIDLKSGLTRSWQHNADNADTLSKGSVRAVLQDAFGSIWVGTYGGGLDRLSADETSFEHFRADKTDATSISGNRITSILEDNERRLWVGTTSGLSLLDRVTGKATQFTNNPLETASLSGDRVTSLYEDRSGLLWVGTQTQGVNTWNPRTWGFGLDQAKTLTADQQRSPNVTSFATDNSGRLWLGTFGDGLHAIQRNGGETLHYTSRAEAPYKIADDRVMSLLHDRDGAIWIGTMRSGLVRLDPVTGEQVTYRHDRNDANSLASDGIVSLLQDSAGRIWVGTYGGGISRLDSANGTFTNFVHDAANDYSLSGNRVMAFAEDPSGMMWIGTEGAGLNLFNPVTGNFHRFAHHPNDLTTLAGDTVYAINVDGKGTVWVGTRSGGLDRVVGDIRTPESVTFANISQTDGLANDVVYGIQFDQAGWLWVSTNYGLTRYNPETGEFRNLERRDGLQSNEFNFGAHARSASGELFFGGHRGYNAFQPGAIESNSVAPLIALTGFFNGNDSVRSDLPVDDNGTVTVDWNQKDVAFEFAALDFTSPERNQYQYKLIGRDEHWVDLGYNRRVTYTGLEKGEYTLLVRAANSDGVWSEKSISLPIMVLPAPWETWWAYTLYALLGLAAIATAFRVHRTRLARESAYSARLEQEVQQRTESLQESNSELQNLNTRLQESSLSDPLTGLRNRRYVFEEVSRDIEAIQRRYNELDVDEARYETAELVFMMIDLDNFKPINDTYGHAAGDEMLLQIRDILLKICRKSDAVVRWGGDEFVVIAKQSKAQESEALAERIRESIETHQFKLEDGVVARTTCSIGFVAYPLFHNQQEASSLDHMICVADGLMYEAKRQRNAWVGMLSADSAVTSENFNHKAIEATSILFRAKRARNVDRGARPKEPNAAPKVVNLLEAGS